MTTNENYIAYTGGDSDLSQTQWKTNKCFNTIVKGRNTLNVILICLVFYVFSLCLYFMTLIPSTKFRKAKEKFFN